MDTTSSRTDLDFAPIELRNDLVSLKKIQPYDFEKLYQVASDPLIWEQHPSKDRYKREVFQKFFDGAIKSGSAYLVFDQQTNDLIGSTRFYDFDENSKKVAIGYSFLATKYWGGEYNKSVKTLMLEHAFLFVDHVLLHIGLNNIRSQKATEKLGAKKSGEVYIEYYGSKVLHLEYVIEKSEWVTD